MIGINLYDRCIGRVSDIDYQLLAIGCMRVASKYEEILVNEIDDFIRSTQNQFTRKQIVQAEYSVLETVNFQVIQTCHTTVVERIRLLIDLEESFNHLCIYIAKLGQQDSIIPFKNQFIFTIALSVYGAEKVFSKNALHKVSAAFSITSTEISNYFPEIRRLLLANHQKIHSSSRRFLVAKVGPGTVTGWEHLLLR